MPIPPFSGVGNDLILPIVPANYVLDIEDNFDKCRANIIDLYNFTAAALGPGSSFSPFLENGQLEVNGNFILHRRMHEVSRTVVTPLNGGFSRNADYTAVVLGAALPLIGAGTYRYQPTICPGWYAPRNLMPVFVGASAASFGSVPLTGNGMSFLIPAGARLFNVNDEAVFFQPVSVHNSRDKWVGRPIRIQIQYETNSAVATPPQLYAAWDVAGIRTFSAFTPLPNTGLGTVNTVTLDVTPDIAANFFEVGVRINDPLAHTFIFRRVVVSSNSQRDISTAYPSMTPVEQLLIERLYFRSVSGRHGSDHAFLASQIPLLSVVERFITVDNRRPFQEPFYLAGLGLWNAPNAAYYARPALSVQINPVSASPALEVTNAVTCDLVLAPTNQGGPGFADYRDWRTSEPSFFWRIGNVTATCDWNPDRMLEYVGEVLTTFKPFLTT